MRRMRTKAMAIMTRFAETLLLTILRSNDDICKMAVMFSQCLLEYRWKRRGNTVGAKTAVLTQIFL